MTRQRTYWHLEGLSRKPSEYELCTTSLLYYPARGFEVHLPLGDWYSRFQKQSLLHCENWDAFHDPRETTYSSYVEIQKRRESFVEDLLQLIDDSGYDSKLSSDWIREMEKILPAMRFPLHGLQMAAAYAGQMSPGGRLAVAFLFQAGDEMRRVHRLAYRMRQLQQTYPQFGENSKTDWMQNPMWQPLRRLIEKLLVTYDWSEAFVALNLAVKPLLDDLFLTHWGVLALENGDEILSKVLYSFREDSTWQRQWSLDLVRLLVTQQPSNALSIRKWMSDWSEQTMSAMSAFAPLFHRGAPVADFHESVKNLYSSFKNSLEFIEAI